MIKYIYNKSFILFFLILNLYLNINSAFITVTPNFTYVIPNISATFTITNFPGIAVANSSSNTVSIINTKDYLSTTITNSSNSLFNQPISVAYSPDGKNVAVANYGYGANNVSIIDTSTNEVIKTIPVGIGPYSLAYSPNGQYIAVANLGIPPFFEDTISLINTSDYSVIPIPVGVGPASVAWSPDSQYIAVANSAPNSSNEYTISIINTNLGYSVTTFKDSSFNAPSSIAYSPDGNYIAVANYNSNTISIISTSVTALSKETKIVNVETGPISLAWSPNSQYIAVANSLSNNVSIIENSNGIFIVIDTIENTTTMTYFSEPASVVWSPNGEYVAVANYDSNTVSIIEKTTSASKPFKVFGKPIPVGSKPSSVAYSTVAAYVNITVPNRPFQSINLVEGSNSITTNSIKDSGIYTFTFYNSSGDQIYSQNVTINFPASPNPAYVIYDSPATFTITDAYKFGARSVELIGPNNYSQTESITSNLVVFKTKSIKNSGQYECIFYDSSGSQIGYPQDVTINFASISPITDYVIPNTSITFIITNAYEAGAISFKFTYPDGIISSEIITLNLFTFTTKPIISSGTAYFTFYNSSGEQIGSPQPVSINFLVSPKIQYVIEDTLAVFKITDATKLKAGSFTFKYPDGTTFSDSIDSYLKSTSQSNSNNFTFTTEPISSSNLGTASFTFYNSPTVRDSSTQIGSPQDIPINFASVAPINKYIFPNTTSSFKIAYPYNATLINLTGFNYSQYYYTNPNIFEPINFETNMVANPGTYTFNFYNKLELIGSTDVNIQFELYDIEIDPLVQSLNSGETLILKSFAKGGVGPYKYLWTKPDGSTIETNGPIFYKQNITPTDSGTYFVTVTDNTGKSITSKSALVIINLCK